MNKPIILTLCLLYSSLTIAISDPSLIAYFPFDGDALDHSTSGNTTEVYGGGLTYENGVFGMSAVFDGFDDYIKVNPRVDVSTVSDFTISVWTLLLDWKSNQLNIYGMDRQYIFDGTTHSESVSRDFYRQGFFLIYDYYLAKPESGEIHNGILADKVDRRNRIIEQAIPADIKGAWHHLAFVRKDGEDVTYLDGQPLVSEYAFYSNEEGTLDIQHPWFIGTFMGNNPHYTSGISNYSYYGSLDELKIWNRALSQDEIAQLSQVNCSNLSLDIDGNGKYDALSDGILAIRYLFGFRGDALIGLDEDTKIPDVVAPDCVRCTASEIEACLQNLTPE